MNAEQLGHASIHFTQDDFGNLLPGSKARASKAMKQMLFGSLVEVHPSAVEPVTAFAAADSAAIIIDIPLMRDSVGRSGLDPGTLGLAARVRSSAPL
jgi:hypothetical protein